MSRDILAGRDTDGGASSGPAPASATITGSRPAGKFSSLLAYLDEASSSHNGRGFINSRKEVVSPHADGNSSSSSSSSCSATSSPGHLAGRQLEQPVSESRRRKRVVPGQNPVIGSRREMLMATVGKGQGDRSRGGARVPWDSSIKPKQVSARRVTAEGARREDSMDLRVIMPSGQRRSAAEELSYASTANRCSAMMTPQEAACEDIQSRRKEDIAHRRGDVLTHERDPRFCGEKRVDSQSCFSSYPAEGLEADDAADSGRRPVQGSLSANGGGRSQRWVWDEWDLDGDNNNNTICDDSGGGKHDDSGTVETPARSASSGGASLLKAIEAQNHSDKFGSHLAGAHATRARRSGRRGHETTPSGASTPDVAARRAFEDVQATARAMREDLRERRSEVLDLKLSLQRVRASNERRQEKVVERWVAKTEAAAAEKKGAAERQRTFTRKLEKDVTALEERLGGMERQVCRFLEGKGRDCALARAKSARNLKKAREDWMTAEKGRLQRASDKKAGAMKQAAARAMEPQLSEIVKSNRQEARAHAEDLEVALLGLQSTLERESIEKVQEELRGFQHALEAELEEERRQAEHQLKLLVRSNEVEVQEVRRNDVQFREALHRDLESERVRFEAGRKRARGAAAKEIETMREVETERAGITLAEHARELREAEEAFRKEEDDTRRRLARETDRWQRQAGASTRKDAEERVEIRKKEAREKCDEELEMVLTRLEAEASQTREAERAVAQRTAAAAADERAQASTAAQELETKAMERYLEVARRQADIESETARLEREVKSADERIRHETERLTAAEQQANEGRERWQSRLDRLEEECSEERKAAREDVSRLSDTAEQVEAAARRALSAAEEEQAALRGSLKAEFNQVNEKIAVVLKMKIEQTNALRERLATLKEQTKARDEELSNHRRRTFS